MSDLALFWSNGALSADIGLDGQRLAIDDGLQTAIIMSLFTDARARADDELPDTTNDRRGWWADELAEVDGDRIGSRLWLLARSKFTAQVVATARSYAEEALAWLVEDGVVQSIQVQTEGIRPSTLAFGVLVVRPDGSAGRFDYIWDAEAEGLLRRTDFDPLPPLELADEDDPPAGALWVVNENGDHVLNETGGRIFAPAA